MACSSAGTRACAAATTDERGTDGERGRVRESGGTLCESGGGQRVGCRASGVCSYLVLSCSPTPLRIAPGGEKRPPHVQDEGAPPIRRRRPRKRAPGGALERGPDRTHSPPRAPEPARDRVRSITCILSGVNRIAQLLTYSRNGRYSHLHQDSISPQTLS